jgi:UTP--glucose-1-phosphate uridylyltransferase
VTEAKPAGKTVPDLGHAIAAPTNKRLLLQLHSMEAFEMDEPQITGLGMATREGSGPINPLRDPRFDAPLLHHYGFDPQQFAADIDRLRHSPDLRTGAFVTGTLSPVTDVATVHFDDRDHERELGRLGEAALRAGQVATLILNGGLATRFGCVVKGVVPVAENQSFLSLKLADIRHANQVYGCRIPVILLNSFATEPDTQQHLREHNHFGLDPSDVMTLLQSISVRLDARGDPFFGDDGKPRYYAPGHGEFFDRLRRGPLLSKLQARGIRYLLFSNGDNLGATIDPVVLGQHLSSGMELTVEVTEKRRDPAGRWDVGGSPARVNEVVQVVEGFRLPPEFPQETLPDFQTNNMVFSLEALAEPILMQRYLVEKTIDGRLGYAFEAVTCECSGVRQKDGTPRLSLGLLRVPRDGERGRFFPVKSREDLERLRPILLERLKLGWAHRERS